MIKLQCVYCCEESVELDETWHDWEDCLECMMTNRIKRRYSLRGVSYTTARLREIDVIRIQRNIRAYQRQRGKTMKRPKSVFVRR